MQKIAITTDTNSGMLTTKHYADGVFVLPMPFIIDDKRRGSYNRGIATWSEDHQPLMSVSLEAQKRFQGKMELCALFQYARYPEPY